MRAVLLALVLCPLALAQPVVRDGDPADAEAILAQSQAFSAAYMRGDTDALVAVYASDGIAAPSGSDFVRGADALRAFWALPEGRVVTRHVATPEELWIDGDLAYDWGTYEGEATQDGEPRPPFRGKYLIVWQRDAGGVWRIAHDMWNTLPRPDPAPSPLEGHWVAEAFGGEIHERWAGAEGGTVRKLEGYFVADGDTTYSERVTIGDVGGTTYLVAHPSTGGVMVWERTAATDDAWTFENASVPMPSRIEYAFPGGDTFTRTLHGPDGPTVLRFRRR